VIRVPLYPRKNGRFHHLILNYLSFVFFATIIGLPKVLFKKYDIVFSWGTSPILMAIPGIFAAKLKRKPHYVWVQDLWPETLSAVGATKNPLLLNIVGLVVKWIYKNSYKILIQSQFFKSSILKWGGKEEQIMYYPNWAEEIFEKDKSKPQSQTQDFKILFAGNVGIAQNMGLIVDTARLITHEKIVFHIYGEGSSKKWLGEQIIKYNLQNKIVLHARLPVEDMPQLYRQHDALFVSLKKEPAFEKVLPAKVQTYLTSGVPIIASGEGELNRVITASGAGFCAPPEDANENFESILKLYKLTAEQRISMGIKGQEFYNKYFTREHLINQLEDNFKKAA